jgi:hypothetical protein
MSATFAAVFVALFVAHQVADHWVQTDHQACAKGGPGWAGRYQCAMHVASYTLTAAIVLAVTEWSIGLGLDGPRVLLGLAISAVTHYVADRRAPLKWLAVHTGKAGYWDRGGAYQLDQSYHYLWLWIAALVIA